MTDRERARRTERSRRAEISRRTSVLVRACYDANLLGVGVRVDTRPVWTAAPDETVDAGDIWIWERRRA